MVKIEMKKKQPILFIAWDNPSSNYLEGLFVPIFEQLNERFDFSFHVIQFSWADTGRIAYLRNRCRERGVSYTHITIHRTPISFVGKYFTLQFSLRKIIKYIIDNQIAIMMPRSTMPARMALAVKRKIPDLKIIFDADGLPIEERVDFAGLRPGGIRHRQLKKIERQIIKLSDVVITRTEQAISFLRKQYDVSEDKFDIVINGRDASLITPVDMKDALFLRKELGIPEDSNVCVYCGSLGPQYGVDQMLYIHRSLTAKGVSSYFLVLTQNTEYLTQRMKETDVNIVVRNVEFKDIPKFLSLGNFAFAIRKATFSMRGVAPIKLGEYLLMGLPVVASGGIGDTESQLTGRPFAHVLQGYEKDSMDGAVQWILENRHDTTLAQKARDFALKHYSLEQSVLTYRKALERLN